MYYHEISFLPQFRFLIYSLMSGFANGLLYSALCNKAVNKKLRYVNDFLFCLLSLVVMLCVNIAFQDAALRVYEVVAFILGLFLYIFFIKKYTDSVFIAISKFNNKVIYEPIKRLSASIINKSKILLKKLMLMVYNLKVKVISEFKEKKLKNAGCKKEKKEKKKKGKTTT